MAMVGDPGNPSVGVVQTFGLTGNKSTKVEPPENSGSTGIYKSCSDAPSSPKSCLTVGAVNYKYGIGEFDTTVSQYVTFLNTVDPRGRNTFNLYFDDMSPTNWPKYGSVGYSSSAPAGQHYTVAYPEWADKPFNFANFTVAARFANSLTNGKVLSKKAFSSNGFSYVTYTVRLSPKTATGMYNIAKPQAGRTKSTGFVVPSNNEWVKAAYYDPKGGGTDSYWAYPTGPFNQPNIAVLNPTTGDVENSSDQHEDLRIDPYADGTDDAGDDEQPEPAGRIPAVASGARIDQLPDRGNGLESGLSPLGGRRRVRQPDIHGLGHHGSVLGDAQSAKLREHPVCGAIEHVEVDGVPGGRSEVPGSITMLKTTSSFRSVTVSSGVTVFGLTTRRCIIDGASVLQRCLHGAQAAR